MITKHNPNMRTGDALTVWRAGEQKAHTEIFAVIEYSMETEYDTLLTHLEPDDTLWMYTSNMPIKDNYLNRAIDQPVYFMELMGYLCHLRNASGYLHWGLNQWNTWTRDYIEFPAYPGEEMWNNVLGDASCVYPDVENNRVRSSIRVEAVREASEQWSLLQQAAQKAPDETAALVKNILRSATDYETDPLRISNTKVEIARLAADVSAPVQAEAASAAMPSSSSAASDVHNTATDAGLPVAWIAVGAAAVVGGAAFWLFRKKKKGGTPS